MADENRKEELIAELRAARSGMTTNRLGLREDLDLPKKFKAAFKAHRVLWLSGAGLLGLLLTKLPPRTKKVVVDAKGAKRKKVVEEAGTAGIALGALKMAFDLAKPFLLSWAKDWAANKMQGGAYMQPEPRAARPVRR